MESEVMHIITLYEHQKLALQYLRLNDSFALFMEQGCGKTLPTLIRLQELHEQKLINKAIVVCPKSVIGSWERDIALLQGNFNFLTVINYDKLIAKSGSYLINEQWDAVVLDEAHYIKGRTTARAKACFHMSLGAKYRYILTGTPVANGQLENYFAEWCFLFPKLHRGYPASEVFGTCKDFQDKYCYLDQWYKPYKYKHVDEMQDIVAESSYRVLKSECLDLPDKLPDEIYEIELQEKQIYKELHKDSTVTEFDVLAENGLSRMAKLRQICSGFINTDNLGLVEMKCEKIKVLDEFINDFDRKLVIFCEFKYSMQQISKLLDGKKINYVFLNGEQKDKSIWKRFQEDESIKVIICQYQSGCAGIDLYAADTIIYYEPTLSSNILEQSKDRIHRIGQKQKCSYIHFITKGTIEGHIYKALSAYKDFNEKFFKEYIQEYQKSYGRKGTN
jgi:SNF2 family DNA or RNA helicase